MTETATILSGFGGQGLLFAGQVLAQAGLELGGTSRGCRRTAPRCAAGPRRAPSSS